MSYRAGYKVIGLQGACNRFGSAIVNGGKYGKRGLVYATGSPGESHVSSSANIANSFPIMSATSDMSQQKENIHQLQFKYAAHSIPKRGSISHYLPPGYAHPPNGSAILAQRNVLNMGQAGRNMRQLYGFTSGDDAYLAHKNFFGVADGVGQWHTKDRGAPALWSRLILHHWARESRRYFFERLRHDRYFPITYNLFWRQANADVKSMLQRAYKKTIRDSKLRGDWCGSTTACVGLLDVDGTLRVANIGDSRLLVIRDGKIVLATTEMQHWFDCPYQLGTNSVDEPIKDAQEFTIRLKSDDIIVCSTDGLGDNLFDWEILEEVNKNQHSLETIATNLCQKANEIGRDIWSLSPWMERATEEGLPFQGGKWDDTSVVICKVAKQ